MGRRVLVVEDESLIAMMIESQLEDLGHEVVATAARLREALGLARTLDVDFAVLDVNLAGELSYPVAEALQARGVPFFFVTGYGAAGLPREFADALVLSKPFAPDQLEKSISRITR